jgi:pimeloyl-ACP methyl ester carboxylesterase
MALALQYPSPGPFTARSAYDKPTARREFARRLALAREPGPAGVSGPPLRRLLSELGALARYTRGAVAAPAARNPQPVMLLPGFAANPRRMRRMQDALEAAGHQICDWGLGLNLGPTQENFSFLVNQVTSLSARLGAQIALVGWSLGGLYAREIARRRPAGVARVITIGSPFSGDRHANNVWRAYQFVTGHRVDQPPIACDFAAKPPVPTIALWSPRDGVVSPRSACGWPGERDRAVALRCNHVDFPSDPATITEVLRQLDG